MSLKQPISISISNSADGAYAFQIQVGDSAPVMVHLKGEEKPNPASVENQPSQVTTPPAPISGGADSPELPNDELNEDDSLSALTQDPQH